MDDTGWSGDLKNAVWVRGGQISSEPCMVCGTSRTQQNSVDVDADHYIRVWTGTMNGQAACLCVRCESMIGERAKDRKDVEAEVPDARAHEADHKADNLDYLSEQSHLEGDSLYKEGNRLQAKGDQAHDKAEGLAEESYEKRAEAEELRSRGQE